MWHYFFREAPLRIHLLLLAAILLLFWVLSSIAATIVLASAGYDLTVLQKISSGEAGRYVDVLQMLQIIQSVCLFVLPPFVYAYLVSGNISDSLCIKVKPNIAGILLSIALLFSSVPLINYAGKLNSQIHLPDFMKEIDAWMQEKENFANEVSSAFMNRPASKLPINLLMIAVIPALGEELLFRAVVQQLVIRLVRNMHGGIWITSVLFGALHLQFFTFLPRIILGSLFGYLLEYSRSLWYPILVHFLNNTMAILFAYFGNFFSGMQQLEKMGTEKPELPIVLLSILLTLMTLWIFRKSTLQSRPYSTDT
ncbi:MAG TPA: CPBP family intramembrane metalloprotease [Bacteroidales bacterium]|nr:CPBP family intramembrane metalloprotease [Bacteroidales bacterium]